MGGVFLLLIIGCLVAILINWLEFIFDIKSKAAEAKVCLFLRKMTESYRFPFPKSMNA